MNIALIIAGGVGSRMKQEIPKQFLTVNDRPLVIYTLEAYQKHSGIDAIAVVCLEGWENVLAAYAKQYRITKLKHIITGGEQGIDSIRNGLFELEKAYSPNDVVLVCDGNRPNVSSDIISDCIAGTRKNGCAISAIPCYDAIFSTNDGKSSTECYPRESLRRIQTPNGFFLGAICDLNRRALAKGIKYTVSTCTLMIELGERVYFSLGSEKNIKITTIDDLEVFKSLLFAQKDD